MRSSLSPSATCSFSAPTAVRYAAAGPRFSIPSRLFLAADCKGFGGPCGKKKNAKKNKKAKKALKKLSKGKKLANATNTTKLGKKAKTLKKAAKKDKKKAKKDNKKAKKDAKKAKSFAKKVLKRLTAHRVCASLTGSVHRAPRRPPRRWPRLRAFARMRPTS
jgi:hypothetical protein